MLKEILRHKVFKNFSYLTIGTAISQILSLLAVLKITKVLYPDDYGLYTFILAQGALLLTIADLGVQTIIVRSIAREPEKTNDLVINGILLRTLALVIVSIIYIVYNYFLGSLTVFELSLVFLFSLISCFGKLFEIVYIGNQKMLPPSIINLIFGVVWFVLIFLLPESLVNANSLILFFLGINVLKNLAFFLCLRRDRLLIGRVQNFWFSSKKLIQESWPYFALTLVMLPYRKFSNNFLDINSTIEEVAFYNLSEKFIGPISMILDIALIAIFPNLSALWISNIAKFKSVISEGFKYYMLLGIVLSFLFTMFAYEILGFLFPPSYLPAVIVCQLQIWFLFLSSVDSMIGTILGATNNEKKILQLGVINSIFSTPIIFYASYYGAMGLSIAYLTTFSIFQFYIWYVFKKSVGINIKDKILMWVITISLFIISYFLAVNLDLVYKIILAILIIFICLKIVVKNPPIISYNEK
jgi:O-antigen/teichoic acid export membrane protein